MKNLKCAVLSTVLALAIGGSFVLNSRAAASASTDASTRGKSRERVKEQLDLTDDQIAQINTQVSSEKGNIAVVQKRMREAHALLQAEIQRPGATEASVRAAATRVSAVESDLAVERLRLYGKISPILTADQRMKLARMPEGLDGLLGRASNKMDSKKSGK